MIFRADGKEIDRPVEPTDLQQRILNVYGIVVEPHMARYVLRRLDQARGALHELPVIGGNARTGVPLRVMIDPSQIASSSPASVVVPP
jgi:hypothetical protein